MIKTKEMAKYVEYTWNANIMTNKWSDVTDATDDIF